jgi:hypothetical protein
MGTLTLFDSVITASRPRTGHAINFNGVSFFIAISLEKLMKKDHNIGVGAEGQRERAGSRRLWRGQRADSRLADPASCNVQ